MKNYTYLIWLIQCLFWLFDAILAGIKQNWAAMGACIWIIVLCITLGIETWLRAKMSDELEKLYNDLEKAFGILENNHES